MNWPGMIAAAVLLVLGGTVAAVPAQQLEPESADCGGSYVPPSVNTSGEVVEPGWTTFGACNNVEKAINGKTASAPTYPRYPVSQVLFAPNKSGEWSTSLQTTDKDGKIVLTPIPARQAQ